MRFSCWPTTDDWTSVHQQQSNIAQLIRNNNSFQWEPPVSGDADVTHHGGVEQDFN